MDKPFFLAEHILEYNFLIVINVSIAYLAAEDCNVISVDWSIVSYKSYPLAVSAVRPLGDYVARLVDTLVTTLGVPQGSIHFVGHSLGAHVAGCVGENSGRLTRISGNLSVYNSENSFA